MYAFFDLFPLVPKLTPPKEKEFAYKLLASHELLSLIFSNGTIAMEVPLFLEISKLETIRDFRFMARYYCWTHSLWTIPLQFLFNSQDQLVSTGDM